MYKVVLVDDEELIIEGMQKLVDWQSLGCEVAGVAYDGDEALDIVNEVEPHILITDIRMPAMNGLEMLDYVKERFPHIVIMIMSGYSDFEYAHQALEKGAACYMLKPVLEKELTERLSQAVKKLEEKRQKKQEEEEITVRLYQMERGAKENFLRKLIKEKMSDAYIKKMWEGMKLCRPEEYVTAIVLGADTPLQDAGGSVIKFAIDNIIEEICGMSENLESVSLGDEHSAIFMMCGQDGGEREAAIVIGKIQETVEQFCKIRMSAGISSAHPFPSSVKEAYGEAVQALEKRFYESVSMHIYKGAVVRTEVSFKELRECGEKLLSGVSSQEEKMVQMYLRRIFHLMLGSSMELEDIYNEVKRLLMGYQGILLNHQSQKGTYENLQVLQPEYLYQFKLGKELQSWFETVTAQVMEFLKKEPSESSDLIDRIKFYISKNYRTATRQNVADYFFLNPSYLSQLFKAETGEVFTEYMTRIRMEEAKKMLEETSYKIHHIAELVGYTSNQHFTRTFKKYTGFLPVEYKKKFM